MKKKWNIISRGAVEGIVKALLKNRNLKTKKQIKEFLNPLNPYLLSPNYLGIKKIELTKAIKRIKRAIINSANSFRPAKTIKARPFKCY